MDLATAAVSIGGSLISAGGGAWVVNAIRKRRTAPVDNAVKLNQAAMAQVDQFQESAARAEATADRAEAKLELANTEIDRLRGHVRTLEDTVLKLTSKLNNLIDVIHEPSMSMDQLRARVPLPPSRNGTGF